MNLGRDEVLLRNNTGNKSKSTLIDGFVVRLKQFEQIFQDIKLTNNVPGQHYLLIGQRGAGKTTLLYRLKYAIEDDVELTNTMIPIMFAEEQYHLSELVNLWESIAEHLEDWAAWKGLTNEISSQYQGSENFEEKAFQILENRIKIEKKTVVVFIENLNVFLKKIGLGEQSRLRDILISTPYLKFVAASTTYFDGSINYLDAFYDFFKIFRLEGLTRQECLKLLLKIGDQYGAEEQIKSILKHHPNRVESLRRITGGVPRTISYLFQIFLDNENGKAIRDLYQLIDTISSIYKSELDQLSTQHQKVIDVIARNWDAISVKEIAKLTRYESKNVSSILAALEKNQLVEIISTKTKNNLYRLRERFMNIWYLMRFGRKHDKENIIWLVRFFDAWCDESELAKRITAHIDNLKRGKYDINAAIDMGNTFLSCENVPAALKYLLYTTTKSVLPDRLGNEVRISNAILYNQMKELIEQKQFSSAISMLNDIEVRDEEYYRFATWIYLNTGEIEQTITNGLKVLELQPNDGKAALVLGILYEDNLGDIPSAEHYLNIALEQKHPYAASRLGDIAYFHHQDVEAAIRYHKQAIKRSFKSSLLMLADIHIREQNWLAAEELIREAIDLNIDNAYSKLGKLYVEQGNYKKAEDAFMHEYSAGDKNALLTIGAMFVNKKRSNIKKAKEYFERAIEDNNYKAYSYLGQLYATELSNTEKARSLFIEGINHEDADSAHFLAHMYDDEGQYEMSDKLFMDSFNWGKKAAIFCLLNSYYYHFRNDKKQHALNIVEEHMPMIKKFDPTIAFWHARLLLWNDQTQKSIEVFERAIVEMKGFLTGNSVETAENNNIRLILKGITNYMILLIAKSEFQLCYSLFENSRAIDLKSIVKPLYYVLMTFLKNEYPIEHLKAGDEYKETITEITKLIEELKQKI